jgi:hypothetical protein
MQRVFDMIGHLQLNWLWVLCTQVAFSSIQFTHESKYMHGCRYALNGTEATLDGSQYLDFMYVQTLGWSYVNTPGIQRCDTHWHQASECRHVQERILIPCCICSWYVRDLLTRPETNALRILHIHKNAWNESHRIRATNWWLLHQCILLLLHRF